MKGLVLDMNQTYLLSFTLHFSQGYFFPYLKKSLNIELSYCAAVVRSSGLQDLAHLLATLKYIWFFIE